MLRGFVYGLCIAVLTSACGGGGEDSSAAPTGQINLSTTFNVDINNLPTDGDLHVYAAIDGGTQQDMQIVNTAASASITNLSIGSHTVKVEVVFTYNNGMSIVLLSASSNVNVVNGANLLDIKSSTYANNYNDDNDGVNNLDEINAGTSPYDSTCVIGVSVINSCTLG